MIIHWLMFELVDVQLSYYSSSCGWWLQKIPAWFEQFCASCRLWEIMNEWIQRCWTSHDLRWMPLEFWHPEFDIESTLFPFDASSFRISLFWQALMCRKWSKHGTEYLSGRLVLGCWKCMEVLDIYSLDLSSCEELLRSMLRLTTRNDWGGTDGGTMAKSIGRALWRNGPPMFCTWFSPLAEDVWDFLVICRMATFFI